MTSQPFEINVKGGRSMFEKKDDFSHKYLYSSSTPKFNVNLLRHGNNEECETVIWIIAVYILESDRIGRRFCVSYEYISGLFRVLKRPDIKPTTKICVIGILARLAPKRLEEHLPKYLASFDTRVRLFAEKILDGGMQR